MIRCVSPLGRTEPDANPDLTAAGATAIPSRIGAILTKEELTYDLTAEDDVRLGPPEQDITRVGLLIRRVAAHADFMERERLQDGRDAALPAFEGGLRKEGEYEDKLAGILPGRPFSLDGNEATVSVEDGRHHRVCREEPEETIELHALVAKAAAVKTVAGLPLQIWRHNRASQLVGFRQNPRGAVVASGCLAKAGLSKEELQAVLRRVAAESDRFEFQLTERDTE